MNMTVAVKMVCGAMLTVVAATTTATVSLLL